MLQEAETAVKDEAYSIAINKYRAAKTCDKRLERTVDSAIAAIFDAITKQRDEAIAARKEAQKQSYRAQLAGLLNTSSLIREAAPMQGAALAKKVFELQPDKNAAELLQAYYADSSLLPGKRLPRRFYSPVAINEQQSAIITAFTNANIFNYTNDTYAYSYDPPAAFPLFEEMKLTADGSMVVGATEASEQQTPQLFLLKPYQHRLENLDIIKEVSDIAIAEISHHIAVAFMDSSFAVYDSSGTMLFSELPGSRMNYLYMSDDGRYIAYIPAQSDSIGIYDCSLRKYIPVNIRAGRVEDLSFSHMQMEKLAIAHDSGLSVITWQAGVIDQRLLLPGVAIRECQFFNTSDKLLCALSNTQLIIMDPAGQKLKEIRTGADNRIDYQRLSSKDNLLYLNLELGGSILLNLDEPLGTSHTIANPRAYVTALYGIADSGEVLYTESNGNGWFVCASDTAFKYRRILDTLYDGNQLIQRCSYSARRKILVEEFIDSIKVLYVDTRQSFVYRYADLGLSRYHGPITFSPAFDRMAFLGDSCLHTFSLLRKEYKLVGRVPGDWRYLTFFKDRWLVLKGGVWSASSNMAQKNKLIGLENNADEGIFTSPDGEHILVVSWKNTRKEIKVYSPDGLLLATYNDIAGFMIGVDFVPGDTYFYIVCLDTIHLRPLPRRLLSGIPSASVLQSIQYNIPGVLEDLYRSKNLDDLVEAAEEYLVRYDPNNQYKSDWTVLQTILRYLETALRTWKYDRYWIGLRIRMLLSEYEDETDEGGEKNRFKIVKQLGLLYNKYVK